MTPLRGKRSALIYICLILLFSCDTPLPQDIQQAYDLLPEEIDFNFDVKPILSDRCFKCHGPDDDAREGDLRFDLEAFAVNVRLESGNKAIVPGRPNKSALVQRILHEDPEEQMPPQDARLFLSSKEKATLIKWIEQGAVYKQHWSFIPPEKHELPEADSSWVQSPIDHFVLERLKSATLAPSAEASKETWLRRVSFDLTGLPPSIEEMDLFLADHSDSAYQRVAERLLSSKHFGERMAINWLDLARYADTHGYQDDGYRFVWPWRDWVVKAFNENLPYDQFLTWQLAGDLLPNATQEQRLATTFLRNHRINSEAGIVGEEYRVEYVADRTNTVATAIMGLTVECARCHDHKYDPISQKEYYQLFSYFNNIKELGEIANEGNPGPLMPLTTPELEDSLNRMQAAITRQEEKLEQIRQTMPGPPRQITSIDVEQHLTNGLVTHLKFESIDDQKLVNSAPNGSPISVKGDPKLEPGHEGNGLLMDYYDVIILGEASNIERTDPFSASIWVKPPADSGYVPVWGNPGNKNQDFRGYELFLQAGIPTVRLCHATPHNYIEVAATSRLSTDDWSHVVVTYDGSSRASGLQLFVNGERADTQTNLDNLYKSIKRININLGGSRTPGGFSGGHIDEFRFYNRPLLTAEVEWLYDQSINQPSRYDILNFSLENQKTYQKGLHELKRLRDTENVIRDSIPEIMVMEEMTSPRPAFVLTRGVYDARGASVKAGTPAIFDTLPPDQTQNRLGLAAWLTSPDHPLTARVAVNQFWQMLFGQGMVATPGDWGNQGALPSHPRLLDWLAIRFVDSGWDVKGLLKEIVLSATYRQSSTTTTTHLEKDPDNLLLARGPAFRLTAEMIRDQALAASGLLATRMGGPPVKPYQPEGLWEELAAIKNSISTYKQDKGENLYRRSLYTFWKRSSPPPSLATFDAPTRELCLVQRSKTSTPLQALVLWNDPQFVEAARVLAEHMMREEISTEDRITLGFRLLTGRFPLAFELEQLDQLYQKQLFGFQSDLPGAKALQAIGEHKRDPSLDAIELASFTVIGQTIMSYDAALIRR